MARQESDREDLLREATALVERIEIIPAGGEEGDRVVAGFRANGALSIFFGDDSVYQFSESGELRRAYLNGLLYKATQGRLVSLRRERGPDRVELVSHELDSAELEALLAEMRSRITSLQQMILRGGYEIVGQVPPDADVIGRLMRWLDEHERVAVAMRPNA